ncbi:conserved hypothetical protein [Hyphomicrobiales bacterium]|nr:conserved hypothetical protein [Hyphomicrobiales bacterium]CAH1700819.1 conserved hypothetical protein [Hyphomicrobiales bacterium]
MRRGFHVMEATRLSMMLSSAPSISRRDVGARALPSLHVSPLSRLSETVAAVRARHLVTLINAGTVVERPAGIEESRHLFLGMSDISQPLEGHVLAGQDHVGRLLAFLRGWDREAPMVIHCWAGISRSTAAAYIAACALAPGRDEEEVADVLRRAAPSATPNARLVALADAALGRRGRMIRAIARIGRGADAFEGTPFAMPLA